MSEKGKNKVDEWVTRQDMEALQRVAEIKKDPARRKACDDMMKKMTEAHAMMKAKP